MVRRTIGPILAPVLCAALAVLVAASATLRGQQPPPPSDDGFRFRSGVELVNVTATVTDSSGRFVPGLRKEDFVVYEDGDLQTVSHFSNERVPVSLGLVLDTSGSMAGEKIRSAQEAIDRFLYDLLDPSDELFLYRFSAEPHLLQDWTTDRDRISRALGRITPAGGTALYDAVAEAVPLAQSGTNRKRAIVVVSDGNDTSSRTAVSDLKQMVRESEVLVYAIGIDSSELSTMAQGPRRLPIPLPFPVPGGGRRSPWPQPPPPPIGGGPSGRNTDERVNVFALREITDDSGGRTEIIRSARDLNPATAGVADELSKQYYLGYSSTRKKDGRWHTIRVELRDQSLRVRARRGYTAS